MTFWIGVVVGAVGTIALSMILCCALCIPAMARMSGPRSRS